MSAPVIPPRPIRPQTKSDTPEIPPRPTGRSGRSLSPNPERFAQSPLNDALRVKNNKNLRFDEDAENIERRKSIIPDIGEEGIEYSVIPDEQEKRTVGDDVKLEAPKPKFPASAAKDRISAVTRTDSDRAAAFGIGKPSGGSQTPSLKKKASTLSQETGTDLNDDREGIPEIGQRIPLLAHAGDVQAPSPAPGAESTLSPRHHTRKTSARGFVDLPEDSYGLRGHGKAPKDKLDKVYYEKHPEIAQREKYFQRHEHDRASNHALDSVKLNKIVRDTASRNEDDHDGIPDEEMGYEAHVEYATRMSRPTSTAPSGNEAEEKVEETDEGIRVEGRSSGELGREANEARSENYSAPILASDEVAKDPPSHEQTPAVEPPPERSGSIFEMEKPTSRPTSRPSSTYIPTLEIESKPLEDVEEYEPLFPEDEKEKDTKAAELRQGEQPKQRFPSKDVWEDAPNSVHATTEVTTPQPPEEQEFPIAEKKPFEERKKEILQIAEEQKKPRSWVEKQLKISDGTSHDPQKKFPSRDVWEDTPDSHRLETTVSGPQEEEEEKEESSKPMVPPRPSKKIQKEGDTESEKPAVPDKPKPVVPPRPVGGKIAALQAGFMADLNKRLQAGPQAPKKEEPQVEDLTEEKEAAPLSDARKSRARGPQRRAPAAKSPAPVAAPAPSEASTLSLSSPHTIWSIEPDKGGLSVGDVYEKADDDEPKTLAANMAGEPVAEVDTETKEVTEA